MASIEKRQRKGSDGELGPVHWRARYRGPDGLERSRSFPRRTDASDWLASERTRRVEGSWTDPAFGRHLYSSWVKQWLATTVNLRPSTRARDAGYLNRYILPVFGSYQLAAIAQIDVRTWVAGLVAEGLAPATVVKAHQIFGKSLQAAVDASLIPKNPCGRGYLPKIELDELRFLNPSEVNSLADAIDPRYRALVLLGAYGGLRIGELAGLRRDRVDILRSRVTVSEIAVQVGGSTYFGPPKTKAGRRVVTVPKTVASALDAHLRTWAGPDFMFTGPDGGLLIAGNFRRREWVRATIEAGLEGITPHTLRHTAVSLWIAAGASLKEVSARAGHTSVTFTLDRYGHLFPESDETLRDRLDDMITSSSVAPKAVLHALGEPGSQPLREVQK